MAQPPPVPRPAKSVRATVRYRIDPPPPPGQPPLTDAVGDVLVNSETEIVLTTRRGVVHIPRRLLVATRIIPPAPPGRRAGGIPSAAEPDGQ